mgnify:CR=1 FL=1
MSFKTFDYRCVNTECSEYNKVIEKLVKDKEQDNQLCKVCESKMDKLLGISMIKTGDCQGRWH